MEQKEKTQEKKGSSIWGICKTQILPVTLSLIFGSIGGFLSSYSQSKGENLATKQDIEVITEKVELVKKNLELSQLLEIEKRKLKFEAIMSALELIDATFSHYTWVNVPDAIIKQKYSTVQARECHNRLLLTVDNPRIIEVFLGLLFQSNGDTIPPTDKLNEFRNLVREELGYGQPIILDREKAWIGKMITERN